ncbi:hypothetical protein BDZ89DRAFT_1049622 [Hymenopellis radicata]|nr:hypothetical protein BDZ89DRAFT_1049622 [Hymenopellis radicata]
MAAADGNRQTASILPIVVAGLQIVNGKKCWWQSPRSPDGNHQAAEKARREVAASCAAVLALLATPSLNSESLGRSHRGLYLADVLDGHRALVHYLTISTVSALLAAIVAPVVPLLVLRSAYARVIPVSEGPAVVLGTPPLSAAIPPTDRSLRRSLEDPTASWGSPPVNAAVPPTTFSNTFKCSKLVPPIAAAAVAPNEASHNFLAFESLIATPEDYAVVWVVPPPQLTPRPLTNVVFPVSVRHNSAVVLAAPLIAAAVPPPALPKDSILRTPPLFGLSHPSAPPSRQLHSPKRSDLKDNLLRTPSSFVLSRSPPPMPRQLRNLTDSAIVQLVAQIGAAGPPTTMYQY